MIKHPGSPATRSQQLLLTPLIKKRADDEIVVIHHVTADDSRGLQLEIERRGSAGLSFERLYL